MPAQVPLPFFLRSTASGLGWSRSLTGAFLAIWIIVYGQMQVRQGLLLGSWAAVRCSRLRSRLPMLPWELWLLVICRPLVAADLLNAPCAAPHGPPNHDSPGRRSWCWGP